MLRPLTALASSMMLAGCSVFGVRSGYEAPAYEVVDRVGERVEIRRYAPRLAAEATVPATDEAAGRDAAFRLLAGYIFGGNRARQDIAMTVPVETAGPREIAMTVPVETAAAPGTVTMRFFLPKELTEATAPAPNDPRVRIVPLPETTLAVLGYTGSTSVSAAAERKGELLDALDGSPWRPTAEPVTLFYDPPWTLPFLRRNEVAVPVERR